MSDPLELVLSKLQRVKKQARGHMARCPAHDDGSASLSVHASDGKVLLKCFAGCEAPAVVAAMGLELSDLFEKRDDLFPMAREQTRRSIMGVTLQELADHKRLPADHLRALGWRDMANGRNTVGIPYPNGRLRLRTALSGTQGSAWGEGDSMVAYDPRPDLRTGGYLVIVEGETDTATLLLFAIPTIGLPGATTQKCIEPAHLEGVSVVFAIQETDQAGEKFPGLVEKRLRSLGYQGQFFPLPMPGAAKDPSALYQRDPAAFERIFHEAMRKASEPPPPKFPTLAQAIPRMLKPVGGRLSTGLAGLDEATRGGIPLGSYCVLVGAPGAAKTTLSVCLADRFERQGCHVLYVAADESARGIVTRFGQIEGFSRMALEEGGSAVQAGFIDRARERSLYVVDPDNSGVWLEDCAEFLLERAKDGQAVLVVDSLQTVRCKAAQGAENALAKTDAVVAACRAVARRGALVLVLSEMSKAGYRGGKEGGINPLSSAKGSSSIEFGVDLFLALTRDPATGRIDANISKSRLGRSGVDLCFQLDMDRAEISEVEHPATGSEEKLQRAERLVLKTIRQRECRSRNEVLRYTVIDRNWGLNALKALADSGRIRLVDGVIREAGPEEDVA